MALVTVNGSDDSQASQLLAAALRPREVPAASLIPAPHDDAHSGPLDGSLQSSGNSVHYHMHGLVATQSQSLYSTQGQTYLEGSQKENAPTSCDKGKTTPTHNSPASSPARPQSPSHIAELKEPFSNAPPPPEDSIENRSSKNLGARTNGLQSPVKGTKAVSFASLSHRQAHPQAHIDHSSTLPACQMPPSSRRRSLSPPSQDSFAGPLSESDPAKAFIAQARIFAIPLSQLGEVSQSVSDEDGPPPVASDMWSHTHGTVSRPSSPSGKVLVAGTPSNSNNDSQSQQQATRSQESQLANSSQENGDHSDSFPQAQPRTLDMSEYLEQPTQEDNGPTQEDGHDTHARLSSPDVSTQPTSSYQRLLDFPEDETPPTQLVDQSTQPADETPPTQIVSVDVSTIARNHEYYNDKGQYEFPCLPSEARSTNTSRPSERRGLRGLVHPDKWYRYEHIKPDPRPSGWGMAMQGTQPSDTPSSPLPVNQTQVSEDTPSASDMVEQTQPSDVAVNGSDIMTYPRRGLPPANVALRSRPPKHTVAPPPRSIDTGFVPDSEGAEPTQIAEPSTSPTKRGLPSASTVVRTSPTRAHHTRHLQSEDEVFITIATEEPSVPVIQQKEEEDQVTDEDEDEEVPLATTVRSAKQKTEEPSVPTIQEEEEDEEGEEKEEEEDDDYDEVTDEDEERHEDEDEEDEVPLATTIRSAKAKGKQKAAEPATKPSTVLSPIATRARAAKPPQSPTKTGIQRDAMVTQRSMSWKNVVIPSSDPQERREDARAAEAKKSVRAAKPRTPIPSKSTMTRSAPRAAKLAARGKLRESSTEDEDEEDGDADSPDNQSDDNDTVPAEDEMDVDLLDLLPLRGNKRKRTVSSSSRKVASKSIVKEESATPLARPAKRAKTTSVLRGASTQTPTRVFALWKDHGIYYPGIVHERVRASKCKIKFDDETVATLDLKHIRLCQVRPGDHVLAGPRENAKVIHVPHCSSIGHLSDDLITVKLDDDEVELVVRDIRLASRSVTAEWGDRLLTQDSIVPLVRPKLSRASPTPSRLSVPSEGSVRGAVKRLLVKTGLVVTLSPNNPEWSHQKDSLMVAIKRHGGVVLEDWTNLYAMEGSFELKGHRWILSQGDIQCKKSKDINRVFLISDDNHQKPKFLIALALGIPCLSVEWLKALVSEQEDKDWRPYLLPAGYSEQLNARVSQMVDLDWGNSIHHLTDITANLVAPKVFADRTILCVSPEFVPYRPKGKKNGSATPKAAEMVPRIVLCMGAATVEAVADVKHASRSPQEYDYLVVRDDGDFERYSDFEHCVDVNWVKDCLISGRLLTLPSHQDQNS